MRRWLLLVFLAAALAFLQACGSSNSNPTPPPTPPPTPKVTITAPADGTTVTTLPTTITVTFSNGADATTMKALLDGTDISAQFSAADSSGTRQVKVDRPLLNLGKNQIQVYAGSASAGVSFNVALSGLGVTSASLPLLVPIQTRVLTGDGTHSTDYNIALYTDPNSPTTPTLIPASTLSDGSNAGFQIVFLRRTDLSVVSNVSLPNPDLFGNGFNRGSALYNALTTTPSGCGTAGCLLIIQSLGTIGYAPCYAAFSNAPPDCNSFYQVFTGLGGSNRVAYANGTNNQVAYSFIGNTNSQGPINNQSPPGPGAYYERLTCSATSLSFGTCDTLGGAPVTLAGTAPANATLAQIGNMSGALVRDNFLNFTYVQTAPAVAFSSGIDTQNISAPNISHNFTINGTAYWSGFAVQQNGVLGGIHVVILDRTTLAMTQNQWWQAQSDASEVTAVSNFLANFGSQNNLIFMAFFGDTHYDTSSTSVAMANRLIWWNMSQNAIVQLGGTQQVFYLMNNQEHAPPQQLDDYTLVGGFLDEVNTGLQAQTYAEMSSIISRETEANPQPSLMEGFLHMDHQGYYSPGSYTHQFGMAMPSVADAVNASRLSPTPWPFPGSDTSKSQAAYTWISQQLCCSDIRAAYINQNVLPQLWLDELSQLSYNSAALPSSDEADFDAMKAQLTTEFQYVAAVRQLQANIRQMYNDQQSNVGLELQQAQDEVTASAQVALNTSAPSASWLGILGDAFSVVGAVGGFLPNGPEDPEIGPAIATAASLGTLATQIAADETNDAAGTSLQAEENINTTAGQMAGKAADEYARTLTQLGNQFDRVVTDWGRLKTLGAPLLANQLPWDSNASGLLLRSYNRVILREFYTKLLQSVAQVNYYPYTSDHSFSTDTFKPGNSVQAYCSYSTGNYGVDPYWNLATVPVLFYPSGAPNTDSNPNDGDGTNYPYDYAWGTWGLVFNEHSSDRCPMSHAQPNTTQFGLFAPLDPNDPNSLGAYRLWFFTRKGYTQNTYTDVQPCYDGSGICE